MNLVIDQGNTRCKIAKFKNETLLESIVLTTNDSIYAYIYKHKDQIEHSIYSSVNDTLFAELKAKFPRTSWLEFTHQTLIPISNNYKSPQTLGLDRIAAAIGGVALFPQTPLLVIDAGTAITYEYVSNENEYLGGMISPGLQMRFEALHTFTKKLPLLKPGDSCDEYGCDTNSAIQTGVQNGILAEVESAIAQFQQQNPSGKIIITGGDSAFFDKRLKSTIFAATDLVLMGLNHILNYSIENKSI